LDRITVSAVAIAQAISIIFAEIWRRFSASVNALVLQGILLPAFQMSFASA
jgi:hypothetical protein